MTRIDFSTVETLEDFTPVPDGKYFVRVHDVVSARTESGDPMWKVKLQIMKGPHTERLIFDNLVFSKAALRRAKHICAALGLDVTGALDLEPKLIWGRHCYVSVVTKQFPDRDGVAKLRNAVLFAGYEPADDCMQPTG